MIKKALILCALTLSFAGTTADAGNKGMKNAAGDKLKISCTGGGCTVKMKKADTKKYVTTEKTKGGSKNYKALVAKYKEQGYK